MPAGEAAGREDRAARHAIARLHAFTNLGPRERARVEHAEALLAQQRHAEARRLAEELAQDFSRAFVPYRIRAGDTLARIAGREDVFANARLWPLLRDANPDLPGDKVPLTEGRVIHVPMHPTVTQISRALERSRNSAGTR